MTGFRGVMLSAVGGVVSPLAAGSCIGDGVLAGGPSSGIVQVNSTGAITLSASSGGPTSGPSNWYTPTLTGAGAGYWVRFTLTAGTVTAGTTGAWINLSASASLTKSVASGTGSASATFTIEIASDVAGANILATSAGWVVGYQHTI